VLTSAECSYRAETLVKLAVATQLFAREMLLERAAGFRQMAEVVSRQARRITR